MTDRSTPDPAARLEAALDRIARLASRPSALPPEPPPVDPALVAQLDSLILQLRAALDDEGDAHGPDQS